MIIFRIFSYRIWSTCSALSYEETEDATEEVDVNIGPERVREGIVVSRKLNILVSIFSFVKIFLHKDTTSLPRTAPERTIHESGHLELFLFYQILFHFIFLGQPVGFERNAL